MVFSQVQAVLHLLELRHAVALVIVEVHRPLRAVVIRTKVHVDLPVTRTLIIALVLLLLLASLREAAHGLHHLVVVPAVQVAAVAQAVQVVVAVLEDNSV